MRILAALVMSALVAGAQQRQPSAASVSSLIEEELRAARVPGAAIAIVSGDEVYAGAYGVSERDRATPMTAATLVHVGSLTKLFTALAVTRALEQRKCRLPHKWARS